MGGKRARGLREARKLISDPERWTKKAYWRTAKTACRGSERAPKEAISFCAVGAAHACSAGTFMLDEAAGLLSPTAWVSAIAYNDSHTHDEVLWMFDLAIAFKEVGW